MQQIRRGVFETNSSSSHSIVIDRSCALYETIYPDDEGKIVLTGGQFGWGYEEHNDAFTKANYMAVFISEGTSSAHEQLGRQEMFIRVICEHTGAKEVVFDFDTNDWKHPNHSYIDHQSNWQGGGAGHEALESEETLKNFIFNPNSTLIIDNDNH